MDYLRTQSSEAVADDFYREFQEIYSKIESNPFLYSEEGDGFRHAPFRRTKYSVLYKIHRGFTWIAAVGHQSRRPGIYKRRTP